MFQTALTAAREMHKLVGSRYDNVKSISNITRSLIHSRNKHNIVMRRESDNRNRERRNNKSQ